MTQEVWVIINKKTGELWYCRRGGAYQNAWPDTKAAKTRFSYSMSKRKKASYDQQDEYELVELMSYYRQSCLSELAKQAQELKMGYE